MTTVPYNNPKQSKKDQVEEMFDNISHRYDLLNHLLSMNVDKVWRKRAINKLKPYNPKSVLDVATGTGDFAIAATKIENVKVTGVDISEGMLEVGRRKIEKRGFSNVIDLIKADSESLPLHENNFDAVTAGFGVRNFETLEKGLAEILRVLKPGGIFIVLEFSKPKKSPFKQLYYYYFKNILPLVGRLISKDHRAYTYLPESVDEFPNGKDFTTILEAVGFVNCKCFPQSFGIASIYEAQKPKI